MGLNDTPQAERMHIGIFGRRNAGKSSVMNLITGQNTAIVSDFPGTTTDPVYKTMELAPLGPVVIIDTAGLDDDSTLGEARIQKSCDILRHTNLAVVVIDASLGKSKEDEALLEQIAFQKIPYLIIYNKADLLPTLPDCHKGELYLSTKKESDRIHLIEVLSSYQTAEKERRIVGEFLSTSDLVLLVVPIDKAAPKGRLILPQQQTIRDILDAKAVSIVVKEDQITQVLSSLTKKPKLVITDSQVFERVAKEVPEDILLTSFSILMARYKGMLSSVVEGAYTLDSLQENDCILMSEGCTHHKQCEDIGSVKLPNWILEYTKKKIRFAFTNGRDFPQDLSPYQLIVHCGACMLNEQEMKYRMELARQNHVPITNYGILISYMKGILKRSTALFPELTQ